MNLKVNNCLVHINAFSIGLLLSIVLLVFLVIWNATFSGFIMWSQNFICLTKSSGNAKILRLCLLVENFLIFLKIKNY